MLENIPGPLLDRMEVLNLSGYDVPEKREICKRYLEPKARHSAGLDSEKGGSLEEGAIDDLIRWYCREAGVRNLKKHVEKIYRKMALKVVRGQVGQDWKISEGDLVDLVGKPPFTSDRLYEGDTPPGVVMGLAWTAMGGASLYRDSRHA